MTQLGQSHVAMLLGSRSTRSRPRRSHREHATSSIMTLRTDRRAVPIGSHRFYFGSLNEYEVDRLAENIGLAAASCSARICVSMSLRFCPIQTDMPL